MKLEKVLDELNTLAKNSFVKVLTDIRSQANDKVQRQIDELETGPDLKKSDSSDLVKTFELLKPQYRAYIKDRFSDSSNQLDILLDIIARDGNCLMSRDWFKMLYEKELESFETTVAEMKVILNGEAKGDTARLRDYKTYEASLRTAYFNDEANNQDPKITSDEQSILTVLANCLELSQGEVKLIKYTIIPLEPIQIDDIIQHLKGLGILFYSKNDLQIYIPDEIVRVLRNVRGREVADKYFRRTLRHIKDSQINLVCRKHGINSKQPLHLRIEDIIKKGISFSNLLTNEVFKPEVSTTDRKTFLNSLINDELKISTASKGATIEDKVKIIIDYFNQNEKDDKIGISLDGYEKLITDLVVNVAGFDETVRGQFEIESSNDLKGDQLLNYNIKPRDILYIIEGEEIHNFCKKMEISTRGDDITNILNNYNNADSLYLENYELFAARDLNALHDNGIKIKESDLGAKFESITEELLKRLGLNVSSELKKKLNTKKNKMDLVIDVGNNSIIIVECKTSKERDYSNYSGVSRQIKSYIGVAQTAGYRVEKTLLIGNDFTDGFKKDLDNDYEVEISLIPASALLKIYKGFEQNKMDVLPYKLLIRDVVLQEDRILKAIAK
jgi:hypothetical protein